MKCIIASSAKYLEEEEEENILSFTEGIDRENTKKSSNFKIYCHTGIQQY